MSIFRNAQNDEEVTENQKWWQKRPSPRPGSAPRLVPPDEIVRQQPQKKTGYGTPQKQRPGTRHTGGGGGQE